MSANDDLRLDEILGAPSQQFVKHAVANLPEDTVSLQWRSKLNERVAALAPVKRRISYALMGARALAGFGITCLVLIAYLGRTPSRTISRSAPAPTSELAVALLSEHRQSVASSEIAGTGISDGEVEKASLTTAANHWNEADLDTTL